MAHQKHHHQTSFTVGTAPLTITASGQSKTYGNTQATPVTGSTAFTSSGLKNSQTIGSVTLNYAAGGLTATSAAGSTSTITPSAATGGTFTASNYTITYSTGTLTVVAAPLTITATNVNKTYGQLFQEVRDQRHLPQAVCKILNHWFANYCLWNRRICCFSSCNIHGICYSVISNRRNITTSNYTITYTTGILLSDKHHLQSQRMINQKHTDS